MDASYSPTSRMKPFIIGGIILLVAAVIGVLVFMFVFNNPGAKFNTFANYILYSKESGEKITGNYDYGDYYIDNYVGMNKVEDVKDFYDKANSLWQSFKGSYNKDEKVDIISNDLKFLSVFMENQLLSLNDYREIYQTRYRDGLVSAFNEYEKKFSELPEEFMVSYSVLVQSYKNSVLDEVEYERRMGAANAQKSMAVSSAQKSIASYADELKVELLKTCFQLAGEINGGGK